MYVGSLKVVTQQLLLQFIVVEKKFSLKTLNDAISSFAYGSDATNKPSVIELNHITSGQLKQSGTPYIYIVYIIYLFVVWIVHIIMYTAFCTELLL